MSSQPAETLETFQAGEKALQIVSSLLEDIGPRPAGSPAEAAAREWFADRLRSSGYQVQTREFTFSAQPAYFPYYALAGIGFALSAGLLPVFPWLAILAPLLAGYLFQIETWLKRMLPARSQSANLLAALTPEALREPDLIFCAHLDTARAVPFGNAFTRQLRRQMRPVLLRVAWILAVLGVLFALQLPLADSIWLAVFTVTVLLGVGLAAFDLWEQLGCRQKYAPGANDNASGAAALLVLAEELASNPPDRLKVGFLFSGAEEAGLCGAAAFAKELVNQGLRPNLVGVDMVGAGSNLRIITETRIPATLRTNPQLNASLERADHSAKLFAMNRRSGDFAAFVRAGLPATGIESNGTPAFWNAYHTEQDDLRFVTPLMLDRTIQALHRLVDLLDKNHADQPHG